VQSGLKYEEYLCQKLAVEIDSLAIAQEQRVKLSNTQAFWLGYGQGDGIEASELANVRVRRKRCARLCNQSMRAADTTIPSILLQTMPSLSASF
jgi:hypothetical protein